MSAEPLVKTRHDSAVVAMMFERGGLKRLCLVRRDGSCTWKLDNGEEQKWRTGDIQRNGPVLSAAWRPYSQKRSILAIGFNDYVVFCDIPSQSDPGHISERRMSIPHPATSLAWAPRGRVLYVASEGVYAVLTIDAALGVVDGTFRPVGFRNSVMSFSWCPAGRLFVSGGVTPVFKIFSESLQLSDTWTSQSPMILGGWAKDGNRILCGNEIDGIVLIDLVSKAQWVLLGPSFLQEVAQAAAKQHHDDKVISREMRVLFMSWEPIRNDSFVVILGGASPNVALLFKCSKLDKIMSCSLVSSIRSKANSIPVRVEFDTSSSRVGVLYDDDMVDVLSALG